MRPKQAAYARRHHLRHQQRVRLRLPARQHGVRGERSGSSAASTTRSSTRCDSILIDEARTPLIISGQADDNVDLYHRLNEIAPKLVRQTGRKGRGRLLGRREGAPGAAVRAGARARRAAAGWAGLLAPGSSLYDAHNIGLMHHLYAALRAHALFHRDQHYVVQNGEVVIVDEFTGRLMSGRRWSDGLHQAVGSEGGRVDPAREPDARVDHVPELLPHVRRSSPA